MALLTTESPTETRSIPRIKKQYRLCYRSENGVACYESVNDAEGWELLLVHPDGSMLRHVIVGVDVNKLFGRTANVGDVATAIPAPAREPERPAAPTPVAEPAAPTAPRDPQYEPWKAPRDTPLSRAMSWGPSKIDG